MDLENKVSLVTGAGQGIGAGIARTLAEKGSKVILVDLNQDSSEKVAKEINNKFSNSAYSFKADLTKSEEIEDMLKFGVSKFRKINCICNNAASSQGIGPVENYSLEDVQTTLDLTFTCLWKCLQAEIKFLKQQDISASVVNISSNSAIKGYAFNSIYAAGKAAVNNLTQSVAKEVARNNIRVNAVSPGTINTPGVKDILKLNQKLKKCLKNLLCCEELAKQKKLENWFHFFYLTDPLLSLDKLSQLMEALRLIKLMYKNKYTYPELIRVKKITLGIIEILKKI